MYAVATHVVESYSKLVVWCSDHFWRGAGKTHPYQLRRFRGVLASVPVLSQP